MAFLPSRANSTTSFPLQVWFGVCISTRELGEWEKEMVEMVFLVSAYMLQELRNNMLSHIIK